MEETSSSSTEIETNNNESEQLAYRKPAVAFDLDETLIHCYSTQPGDKSITTFPVRMGRKRVYVTTRPHLREFLDLIEQLFEVFIFTSSLKEYANQIIDHIAPEIDHSHRFCRNECINTDGYHVKDLRKLSRPLNRIILVDDMQSSALLQRSNLIRILPYLGDQSDTVLVQELFPTLQSCSDAQDVRTVAFQIIQTRNYQSIFMN